MRFYDCYGFQSSVTAVETAVFAGRIKRSYVLLLAPLWLEREFAGLFSGIQFHYLDKTKVTLTVLKSSGSLDTFSLSL